MGVPKDQAPNNPVDIDPSPKYFLDREIAITGKAPGQGNTEGLGSAPALWSLEGENRSELGVESQEQIRGGVSAFFFPI